MEKVSLKLVILYMFMTYMAIMIIRGRLLSGHSIGKEPAQPKEMVESKKPDEQVEGSKESGKDDKPKSSNKKEEKRNDANDLEDEDLSGKFPQSTVPALISSKSHLGILAHLFEGTTN